MTGIIKTDQLQGAQGTTVTVPTGNTLAVTSNATVGGTLGVTGNTTMGGTAAITGNTTVGGTLVNTGLITASAGVAIGGTGSANTLDDYEEGTWTPVWSSSSGGSVNSYGPQVGVYTKVGNMVHLACYMAVSDKGSISGTLSVAGLPFASEDRTSLYQSGSIWMNTIPDGSDFDGDFHIQIYMAPNNDKIALQSLDGDGGTANLTHTSLTTNTDLMINISYRAA